MWQNSSEKEITWLTWGWGVGNIKMDLKEAGWEGVAGFIWLRIGIEYGNGPFGFIKGRELVV